MNSTKQYRIRSLIEIFLVSTRLGLTSFGGPTAHLGYFHEEYVRRRKWMDEKSYADLVALCQFLPGPSSSQVGIGIGIMRAGIIGGITSFIGFTFPSVVALIAIALLMTGFDVGNAGWIHGLKIVAVAIVAHAIIGMAKNLTPDLKRKAIAIMGLLVTLLWQTAFSQVGVILIAAFIGFLLLKQENEGGVLQSRFPVSKQVGGVCLLLFVGLLVALPLLKEATGSYWIAMFDSFYRSGSFVFGGGHVVLPLLENEFVPTGRMNEEAFLAGYGVTQAVPGPLFTFAAYLGTVMNGRQGGIIATVAIFLPFLLVIGAIPFWDQLRNHPKITGAILGVNAAVIGILIAALYSPIWTSSILEAKDFALAVVLFSMLAYWKMPPWIVVVTGAVTGLVLL